MRSSSITKKGYPSTHPKRPLSFTQLFVKYFEEYLDDPSLAPTDLEPERELGVRPALVAATTEHPLLSNMTSTSRYFAESPMVALSVDGGNRRFSVHKDILCSRSNYFAACLNNPLASEAQSNEIKLSTNDGHDEEALGTVVDWIYQGPQALVRLSRGSNGDYNANREVQVALTRVYIQAHKLLIHQLKNDIVDNITGFAYSTLPSLNAITMLYDAVLVETPLWGYYLDCLSYWLYTCPRFLRINENGWHVEANRCLEENGDLAYEALKRVCSRNEDEDVVNPNEGPGCTYHEHDAECSESECLT